jgi:hypothetical protein
MTEGAQLRVVIHGPDRGLAAAFEADGAAVTRATAATAQGLADAGIESADAFVLTDADRPTALVTARDANPDCRIVVYAAGSLPDFATTAADLLLDPALFEPEAVADELVE